MMDTPLTLLSILKRAKFLFPKNEIVSRGVNGIFRYTYGDFYKRTHKLAGALNLLGVKPGDRVATLAWNDHRHLEAYFAVPSMGAILHTINFRLSPEHLIYIINHAEDKIILVDETIVPVLEAIQDKLKTVKVYIILSDKKGATETKLRPAYYYEQLIEEENSGFQFSEDIKENDPAGMCFTSATTGNPKGVLYSHRGLFLHSMAIGLTDTLGLSERDSILPIVPMFHVNAWGLPFGATMFGSKQVLPGPAPTPKDLLNLMSEEKVTLSAGVPTIWLGVLKELDENKSNYDTSSIRGFICGGSAAPRGMIKAYEDRHNIQILHAYGMTETTPLVFASRLKNNLLNLSSEEQLNYKAKQGLIVPGIEMKVIGKNGEVKHDGKEMGELLLRGPWIASEYYNDERTKETFIDGWLHTGDVVTVDEEGYVQIVDRTKDLVKSGGEWISSVDLENALMTHEAVFEASVFGVAHPKWQERPIAVVVLKDDYREKTTKEALLGHLAKQFAKWWLPDDIIFVDEIPKTSVGKFLKRGLREKYQNYLLDKES
ncbi:fatty-acid--CoA ligase [Vulcanibacillus modesticaldus]|uniref:Fatty-acid--CoA ligase n=1 Tax=Vulcanibacillus modesticaldus TaxID=337097 RepID=A0A1D2YW84_9BACI|nr:long-chain fatty acid--CoA ligase [Vulcanibacillus modesticaldus]OEF99943.1 fatty-acid--CoA ligase [Vulcanibacillus modesticaldus]